VLRAREPGWFEHRMFKGPDTDINLHVFTAGAAEIDRMLLFRDWLRANDFDSRGIRMLLFTSRFNPATLPGASDKDRLALVEVVQRCVFGWTNRTDEALHLILDILERQITS
jgi:hypothetical protein